MNERTIFKALSGVQSDLAKIGISKNQTNAFDKYRFRGIDDVLNAMAPILASHGVLIIPSVIDKEILQVATAKGGTQNHAVLKVNYTLYDISGDCITHTVYGEAFDRGDKSINKALTSAYKYFLFQCFCIPLVGDDADSESHDIADQPKITQEQTKRLHDAIHIAGIDEKTLCQKVRIKSVGDLTQDRFEGAINYIKSLGQP